MTLPRRLTVEGDAVFVEPAGDLESLRGDLVRVDGQTLAANQEVVLDGVSGNAMEIVTEIDPKDAPMVELNVLRSPNRQEFTRIAFYGGRGYRDRINNTNEPSSLITLDTSYSSTAADVRSRAPETSTVPFSEGDTLKLRIFIDRSVVEVFVNNTQCLAARVYPDRGDSLGVSLRSQGSTSELISFDAWQMADIYKA